MSRQGRRGDPHHEKRLDLARQRVNVYGESPKGSRSAIRRRKAWARRSERRRVASELRRGEEADTGRIRRDPWRKWPDKPFGDVLARKVARRARLRAEPRKNDAARARRSARRAGQRR